MSPRRPKGYTNPLSTCRVDRSEIMLGSERRGLPTAWRRHPEEVKSDESAMLKNASDWSGVRDGGRWRS